MLGVVDYAHKPDAIVAALAALREVTADAGPSREERRATTLAIGQRRPAGRLICVIGAGGDRDRGKRPFMGEAAARGADLVLVTDDNPRSEDPAAIRAEVLAGATGAGGQVGHRGGRAAGRRSSRRSGVAEPGDVVAVLGKGHERGQEVAGLVTPFDDRVELAAALAHRFAEVRPVIPMSLAEIAEAVGGTLVGGDPASMVTGAVEFDSRAVGPGGLFVAFAGANADGHDFVPAAVAAGAVAVLGTRPTEAPTVVVVGHPRRDGPAGPGRGGPAARPDDHRDHRVVRARRPQRTSSLGC